MRPDDLTGEPLRQAAALADGAVDVGAFDPLELFLREACVMEKWGAIYVVHVRLPRRIAGLTAWVKAQGACPLDACMRAFIKSRRG